MSIHLVLKTKQNLLPAKYLIYEGHIIQHSERTKSQRQFLNGKSNEICMSTYVRSTDPSKISCVKCCHVCLYQTRTYVWGNKIQ